MSTAPAPPLPGVTFEVERFEWASDDRLEVVGRWFGLRGQRFLRPTLDVEVRGERRRMLALLEHKPWAAEEGQEWVAAFAWAGERARLDDAELTVSPDVAVQLPLPDGAEPAERTVAPAPGTERLPARRPRTAVLEEELSAALAELRAREEELARLRETHSQMTRELRDRAREAQERARQLETELERTREQLAAGADEAERERRSAGEELERQLARTREELGGQLERMREERDAAAADRNRAQAEAEAAREERDEAMTSLTAAEGERDSLVEARDRARQERNAWMSRARASAAEARGKGPIAERVPLPRVQADDPAERPAPPEADSPAPPEAQSAAPPEAQSAAPPAGERRTIRIGERPAPLRPAAPSHDPRLPRKRWTPVVIAAVALAVAALVVALLLLLAF
jgi:hypothetical protein